MIRLGFKRCFFFVLFGFWSWSDQGFAAQEVNYKLVPNLQQMKDSSPTPDFTLPDPAGKKVSLKDFRGKLVMLNCWATASSVGGSVDDPARFWAAVFPLAFCLLGLERSGLSRAGDQL